MATKFIKYEKALLTIADTDIFAESAELAIDATLTPISNITGSVIRYAPDSPVKGTLSFSHYCTGNFHDFLNPLTAIEHTGEPFEGSLGPFNFTQGYVKSLNFSVAPYSPILFRSSMDIYGELSINDTDAEYENKNLRHQTGMAHSMRSYIVGTDVGINNKVSFDYAVSCERNPVIFIGDENPSRVTKENVRINLSIAGEDIGSSITITGNYAALEIQVLEAYGNNTPMGKFGCTGQIFGQNLSISEGGYADGTISVSQEYLTGRAFY